MRRYWIGCVIAIPGSAWEEGVAVPDGVVSVGLSEGFGFVGPVEALSCLPELIFGGGGVLRGWSFESAFLLIRSRRALTRTVCFLSSWLCSLRILSCFLWVCSGNDFSGLLPSPFFRVISTAWSLRASLEAKWVFQIITLLRLSAMVLFLFLFWYGLGACSISTFLVWEAVPLSWVRLFVILVLPLFSSSARFCFGRPSHSTRIGCLWSSSRSAVRFAVVAFIVSGCQAPGSIFGLRGDFSLVIHKQSARVLPLLGRSDGQHFGRLIDSHSVGSVSRCLVSQSVSRSVSRLVSRSVSRSVSWSVSRSVSRLGLLVILSDVPFFAWTFERFFSSVTLCSLLLWKERRYLPAVAKFVRELEG